MRLFFLFLFSLFHLVTKAQVATISEANWAALGGASVSLVSIDNPSACSFKRDSQVSVNYQNPYAIKELSTVSAHLFVANRWVDAGVIISHFGLSNYNENRLSAQFSKKLSSHLSLGVRLNYFGLMLSDSESNKSIITSDLGFLYSPTANLVMGFSAENLLTTSYTTARGEFSPPSILRFGANYRVAKELLLIAELASDAQADAVGKFGMEYQPLEQLALRMGARSTPLCPTFGIGYTPGHLSFDIASLYHTVLGFHNQFSMKYYF